MIEKFKRYLAEISLNSIEDRIARHGGTDSDIQIRNNLRNYLKHKPPFGG